MIKTNLVAIGIIAVLATSCSSPKTKNESAETQSVKDIVSIKDDKAEKKPFTSTHIFTAKYDGTDFHKCKGMTSLCPDKCGESGNVANFKVVEYKDFVVNGQGGSEKLDSYQVLASDFNKKDLDKPYVATIKNLKKGDEVTIDVEFVYDTTKTTVQTVENIISITNLNNS